MPMSLLARSERANARPFSDWLAAAQRQCARRTGNDLAANDAPASYWQAAYWAGMMAWDAADAFLMEADND